MNISVTKAAKEWGISRTTIYQKFNDGKLSRTIDKKIDVSEMLRVFGEPTPKKRTERLVNTVQSTPMNAKNVPCSTDTEHQLAFEKLKNQHLNQQVSDQKKLIENYQQQIAQLNKTLDKANTSIQDFAQVRLLEFKKSESDYESLLEQKKGKDDSPNDTVEKKKRWWGF